MRVFPAVLCLLAAAPLFGAEPTARDLYQEGRAAEKKGHFAQAYLRYAEAAAMDPKNPTYWQHSQAIRTRAALEGLTMPAAAAAAAQPTDSPEPPPASPQETPTVPQEASAQDKWDAVRKSPPQLKPDDGTGDIDIRGDSRQLWEQLAKLFGLEAVFDPDYQPLPPSRFRLKDVNFDVAFRGLQAATGTFVFPLTSTVFMVAKDTPQKRTELQPRVAISIPLPDSFSPQDFAQAVTAVQQSVGIEKISFDSQAKIVIIRDTPAKAAAARALFRTLMRPPAQVMVQLKLIEVTRNDLLTYGIDFPNMFSLSALTNWFNNQLSPPTGISGLLTFGGGKTLMGLGILNAALVAQMSKSTTSNLLDSELRTTDGIAANMHIGEQYPVLTSEYVGPSNFTAGGAVYTPPPSFQFVDLGLSLKVTPSIRTAEAAALDIDAEYKVLTGQAVNGIPVIGNRAVKTTVSLHMGDWAVIGGLLDVEQAHTIAGLAGVTRIPYLSPLVSTHNKTETTDQILLLIRPYLVSLPPSASGPGIELRLGSDTRPASLL